MGAAVDGAIIPDLGRYAIDSHWRWGRPAERRILLVYAHPDDEAFGNAGTIMRYADAGVAVHYACATRGESGTVDAHLLEGYADVGALRTAEQLRAAEVLDLAGVHFLGYRDSGMAGTPENQHPQALAQAPLEQVAGQIVALIRAIRPQVVVTFNPYGGYGHPDHIVCHRATHLAIEACGDAARYPEQLAAGLAPHRPERMYYSTFSPRTLQLIILLMRLTGRDPRRFGRNKDVDFVRVVEETTPITTEVRTPELQSRKERAWACHHSQGGGPNRFSWLPIWLRSWLSAGESYTRVLPPWAPGAARERGLFGE